VIRHGLVAAGRYLSLHVRVPDRPGELAHLLALLAGTGTNVLDVVHLRTGPRLSLGEVEVELMLETRGADHGAAVVAELTGASYRVDEAVTRPAAGGA